MVSYHGQIKVTDFGLATHAIKRELTKPGVVFGRYSYLSPEQARGLPADRRTDIYASGIVLWEMLTGRQLFPADRHAAAGAAALSELRKPKISAPSDIVPGIPDGLEDLNRDGMLQAEETDPAEPDSDFDGIPDGVEDANRNGMRDAGETSPIRVDTDQDALDDGVEDANQNGVVDPGETDPRNPDSDGDGLNDRLESEGGTSPTDPGGAA